MTKLELTPREVEVLVEILNSYVSDLRMEIAGTERIAMRTVMKEKEAIAKELLVRLAPVESGGEARAGEK